MVQPPAWWAVQADRPGGSLTPTELTYYYTSLRLKNTPQARE